LSDVGRVAVKDFFKTVKFFYIYLVSSTCIGQWGVGCSGFSSLWRRRETCVCRKTILKLHVIKIDYKPIK